MSQFRVPLPSLLLGLLAFGGALGSCSRAAAQSEGWLVLPVTVAPPGEAPVVARPAAKALSTALGGEGGRVFPARLARTRFQARGSTAPIMVSHGDLDELARDTRMALYHVASGLHGRARKDVERALARADKVLESLNREAMAAQQLLDACLYLVRSHLQGNKDRRAARAQALECRRLVPDIEPDGTMHPPDVIGILAEAEAELRQQSPGSLRVESEPPGCSVYVNGRNLGSSPLELSQLSPGEYRIQAECEEGRVGRVHRVTVAASRVVKRIDTRFDAAVQTGIDLSLRYASEQSQRRYAYRDAVEAGRVVGAEEVLLVLPLLGDPGVVQANRIRVVDGELRAAVRLRFDEAGAAEKSQLVAAARALRDGETTDFAGTGPRELAAAFSVAERPDAVREAPPQRVAEPALEPALASEAVESVEAQPEPASDDDAGSNVLGIVLGVAGGAATLTGWALYAHHVNLELEYGEAKLDPSATEEERDRALRDSKAFEVAPLATTAAGAAVLTASLPLWLPEHPGGGLPWWAIGPGVLGVAAAAGGVYLLVDGANCEDFDSRDRCLNVLSTTRLGGMLAASAVPFLAVPTIYLLRDAFARGDTEVAVVPYSSGMQLKLRGHF